MGDKNTETANDKEGQKVDDVVEGERVESVSDTRVTGLLVQDCSELTDHVDNGNDDKSCSECGVIPETESTLQDDNIISGKLDIGDVLVMDRTEQINNSNNTSEDTVVNNTTEELHETNMQHATDNGLDCNLNVQSEGKDCKDGDLTVSFGDDSTEHEGATGSVEHTVSTRLHDAPLTYVDEDDGLFKFLGKACGVDKKKLLDEDEVPYSGISNKKDKRKSGSRAQRMHESVGERLAQAGFRTVSPIGAGPGATYEHDPSGPSVRTSQDPEVLNASIESRDRDHEMRGRTYYKRTDDRRALSPRRQPYNEPSQSVLNENPQAAARTGHAQSVDEDRYDFTHMMRGYMVLVVNDKFPRQTPRDGALEDLRKMKAIGSKFGFRSMHYQMKEQNLTKPELLNVLLDAQRTDHSNCDCFLFMISTHGLEQKNALKGGQKDHALVCADEQLIFTSSIIEMFNDTNCPSLKGKPKIFLIQACRGEELDHGHDVFVAFPKFEDKTCSGVTEPENRRFQPRESFDISDTRGGKDSWRENQPRSYTAHEPQGFATRRPQFCVPTMPGATGGRDFINVHGSSSGSWTSSRNIQKIYAPTPYGINETPSLSCDSDMLVMYAIPPGKFAWRNSNEGSWMIDYLYQVLMRHDLRNPKSFLSLLSRVNARMSHRSTYTPSNPETDGKTAISVIEHKLCKDIIFEQKVPLSTWLR
ncbi:hypothetical protein ACF0H5_000021 [Mactra antiquata]